MAALTVEADEDELELWLELPGDDPPDFVVVVSLFCVVVPGELLVVVGDVAVGVVTVGVVVVLGVVVLGAVVVGVVVCGGVVPVL